MMWLIGLGLLVAATALAPALAAALFMTIGGTIIGTASKLMDVSLYTLVANFDIYIYGSLAPVINELWTVFRDIANILIIGMFTFIAISMILGIEKYNARQTVAKILLIAVLINFSLLFTRIIIASSNFVAGQFYCSMIANTGQSGICGSGPTPALSDLIGVTSSDNGIGREFMKFLRADTFMNSWNATANVYSANAAWSNLSVGGNIFALLYGLTAAVLLIAAALVFSYIVFLLVARTILFIFLLITSAPAFASHLIPGKGGHYWSMWWDALLRNAIFAPLLMMMLWATFLISRGLAASVGGGASFETLFTNQSSGSGYLAIIVFAIILGMLYASARFASSFAKGISGFDWASVAPAMGAGLLGRASGFFGRQTIGRASALARDDLASRAKDAKAGSYAQRLYNFGAQNFGKAATRDFNLMRGQLGKEIAGVAHMKDIAGKELGGFQGVQDKFKKEMAESAVRLAYNDEDKKAQIKKELEAKAASDPTFKSAYAAAEKEHADAKVELEKARKEAAVEIGKVSSTYKTRIETLERDRLAAEQAFSSGTGTKADRDRARDALKQAREEQKLAMDIESNKIKRAEAQVNRAAQEFENLSASVIAASTAAGRLPDKFASAGDIAEATVKNSFTSLLKAAMPTAAGVEKLAAKAGKEAGKPKVSKTETVDLARVVAREKLGEDKSKKP